ncbi:MAG: hypothetical protein PHI31_07920 [Desulfuromonadaceae bacterium]|nr:hypothetical protein [Desulfuromonadaceae bacterium]
MKKRLIICMAVVTIMSPVKLLSAEKAPDAPASPAVELLQSGEKDTIYVDELKIQPSVLDMAGKKHIKTALMRVSDSLENQVVSALSATRVFQLVERRLPPANGGVVNGAGAEAAEPDNRDRVPGGTATGARFAFRTLIDGFDDTVKTVEHQAIGRVSQSRTLFLSASVQIVDTLSGKLLPDSPSVQLTKTEETENARMGQLSGSDELLVAVAKEMARTLSQEVVALLRPAKVLTVTGRQILINRGSEYGFSKGDLVEIFTVQRVRDDDTGEFFHNEVSVGQAVISRIEKNQSYAAVTGDDTGITKGSVVRFVKSAARRAVEAEPPPDVTLPDFGTKGDRGNTPGSSEKPLKWK